MNTILNKIAVFLIGVFLLPAGLFVPAAPAAQAFSPSPAAPASPIKIVVVQTPPGGQSSVVLSSPTVSGLEGKCSDVSAAANGLLQGSSRLDLNQPAGCLTLVPAKPLAANRTIKVLAAPKALPVILVARLPQTAISPFSVNPAVPQNSSMPLAAAFAVFETLWLVEVLKAKQKTRLKLKPSQSLRLSLSQLQVFRF